MKGFDLRGFKKVSSDEKKTVMKHPESGHQIIIAHGALSSGRKKQLDAIPSYSDGGEVEKEEPGFIDKINQFVNKSNETVSDANEATNDAIGSTVGGAWDAVKRDTLRKDVPEQTQPSMSHAPASIEEPTVAPQAEAPMPVPEVAPSTPQSTLAPAAPLTPAASGLTGAMNQYQQGVAGEAKALGEQGNAEAKIQDEQIKAQQEMIGAYKEKSELAMAEINHVMEDYRKQHINPKHYMESMSSGQKVMTAIGLILSGFGGDGTAGNFLEKQVDRDIAAQEKELGKTENLLSFNLKQYGNMNDAMTMTQAMQKGLYAAKLEQAASLSKDPIAKARALQAAAKFRAEMAPNIEKFAQSQALRGVLSSGPKTEADFKTKLNALGTLSPDMQKDLMERYIPGVGLASTKPSDKDKEALASISQIKKGLTELQARAATIGTTVPGSAADAENKAKVASLQLQMKNAFQLGVLSGSDLEMLEKLTGDPGAILTGKAISRLDATKKSMDALEQGVISKLGVTPFQGGGGSMEGRTASDAKGNKIIMKNGQWVPYGS